jgi:hypothetical protein
MRRSRSCVVCLVSLLALSDAACATLMMSERVYECTWLEVSAPPEVLAVAPRLVALRRPQCGDTGEYRLARPEYVLEFYNGIKADSVLYVRARTSGGSPLMLESDALAEMSAQELSFARRPSSEAGRAPEFTHRLRVRVPSDIPAKRTYPLTVSIRVLDAAGNILGVEMVTVIEKEGTFTEIDAV